MDRIDPPILTYHFIRFLHKNTPLLYEAEKDSTHNKVKEFIISKTFIDMEVESGFFVPINYIVYRFDFHLKIINQSSVHAVSNN